MLRAPLDRGQSRSFALLTASLFHQCFGGHDDEVNSVRFAVAYQGSEIVRSTTVERAGVTQRVSPLTPIRRR